jgi:hypothetical protein
MRVMITRRTSRREITREDWSSTSSGCEDNSCRLVGDLVLCCRWRMEESAIVMCVWTSTRGLEKIRSRYDTPGIISSQYKHLLVALTTICLVRCGESVGAGAGLGNTRTSHTDSTAQSTTTLSPGARPSSIPPAHHPLRIDRRIQFLVALLQTRLRNISLSPT